MTAAPPRCGRRPSPSRSALDQGSECLLLVLPSTSVTFPGEHLPRLDLARRQTDVGDPLGLNAEMGEHHVLADVEASCHLGRVAGGQRLPVDAHRRDEWAGRCMCCERAHGGIVAGRLDATSTDLVLTTKVNVDVTLYGMTVDNDSI
jgi:hypothetical protein